jgi:hypothetical protein
LVEILTEENTVSVFGGKPCLINQLPVSDRTDVENIILKAESVEMPNKKSVDTSKLSRKRAAKRA